MIVKQSLPKVRIHDLAGKGRHRCRDLADDVLGDTEFAQCLHQVDRDRIEVPLLDGESAMGISPRGASRSDYFSVRITPTATDRRSRSGSFRRAFSADAFVLNGFDNGVNWPPTYLKSSHCSTILGISFL